MLVDRLREIAATAVEAAYGRRPADVSLEIGSRFGDFALNCFHLARELRQAPPAIAAKIAPSMATDELITHAEAASGYVNLTIARSSLFGAAIGEILTDPHAFGAAPASTDRRPVMVEFSSPNTNKPQHLGHVRNNLLGDAIARLVEARGQAVVRANLVNDRGIHICKSMLAYQREGNGVTPASSGKKGDHLVGDFYVLFEMRFRDEMADFVATHPDQAGIDRESFMKQSRWMSDAQAMLQRWEAGDEETVALWREMNGWVLDGFKATYEALGIRFDRIYFESQTYSRGKEIVERGLDSGVFQRRADGAVEIDLTAEKLDRKVVLRSDGTSVYITQDIATTIEKFEEHGLQSQIFVVGDEQAYHFKVLFSILRRLGYEWADDLHHLAYGMVNLPEGKMKSREGTVVDADDLIDEVTRLAQAEIAAREPDLDAAEAATRARAIGLAALKFMILAVSPQTTMVYDPKESVSFEGDTGPYVLYAYARIKRMLGDVANDELDFDSSQLGDESEVRLALMLLSFPGVVARAGRDLNPSLVATWLIDTARAYHSHNRAVPILKAEDPGLRRARLALSRATGVALARGLELLGIATVDRM